MKAIKKGGNVMLRSILGAVVGVVVWYAAVFVVSLAIKAADPSLGAALVAHATNVALWERLAVSFVGTILAGLAAALVARESRRAPLVTGVLLLAVFVPYHLFGRDAGGVVWTAFPLWYHLTFFVSLPVLSLLGGRLAGSRR